MNADRLLQHYETIADAPDAIARLRRFILDLAVRGKLVPQDLSDEPASELLRRIAEEKARLVKAGEIKKPKHLPDVEEPPFDLPKNWRWTPIREVASDRGQEIPRSTFTYIDVTAIDKEAGVVADPKVLEASAAPSRARKITRKGDVIYSCVRPYLLNVAVIETDFDPPPIASTAFAILNGHGLVVPRYLWIVLRSPFMIKCVEENQRGQAYPAINDADFAVLPFPLPPLAEQHRIVAKVDELMGLCDRLEAARTGREVTRDQLAAASLARLNAPDAETFGADTRFALDALPALTTRPDQIKALRHTILNLAVCGKLVPQDANEEPAAELLKRLSMARKELEARKAILRVKSAPEIGDPVFLAPKGWHWCPLVEICDVVDPNPSHRMPHYLLDGGFPFISSQNFADEDKIDYSIGKRVAEATVKEQRDRFAILEGAFGFSRIGTIGKTRPLRLERDYGISHAVCVINPVSTQNLSMRYLRLAMSAETVLSHARHGVQSVGVPDLGMGVIRTMAIPLPPLAEQHRIVAKVDALMALCDQLEAGLDQTAATRRRLLDALLAEALAPAEDGSADVSARPTVELIASDVEKVDFAARSAYILSLAYERHCVARRERTFGHVKAQKILHLVEAEARFDLGRAPIRDAAGPNDFKHMLDVEQWAREQHRFVFEANGAGYLLRPLSDFGKSLATEHCPDPLVRSIAIKLIDILVPLDTRQAEILATVYAAWNNLLIEGKSPTDTEIVRAARDDWHPDKLKLPANDFFAALAKIRHEGVVPKGAGKFVHGPHQKALFN